MSLLLPPPRPGLHPLPSTVPLGALPALLPPFTYYLALLLLPPFSRSHPSISFLRSLLALLSAVLFFRLPFAYYIPFSVGLTYQLALVGLYGGCRVIDAFFISPYLFGHIPRRVQYNHRSRVETPAPGSEDGTAEDRSYFSLHFLQPKEKAVMETATTDAGLPRGWRDRASWALELELSMRGAGFTWTSADVRHTRKTWTPTVGNRVHSILLHVLPCLVICWGVIRWTYCECIAQGMKFDDLPFLLQLLLTAALGGFLMSAFSLGHSSFAILLNPLSPHPLSYFPVLYTSRVWALTSVRGFWSYGWHRLFSRLFLVYGVWPGEWIERKTTGKSTDEQAEVGKILGAFMSSAFVHSFASWTVHGGVVKDALGETWFFIECGAAVLVEEMVKRAVVGSRMRQSKQQGGGEHQKGCSRWYDRIIGRIWWISVLLCFGRNFARGWTSANLVREMAGA